VPGQSPPSVPACFTQPRNVSGTTSTPRPDPQHHLVHRQRRIFRPGLGDQTLRTLAKLWRVLPRVLA